ncbi:ribonuclease HII, putative [Trypanosoma equiperdum]|uniref:Ribonuclease n=2 Tax=Trypanozoon TaxID=39700 RepID=Q38BC8_TRYB2|nr:ribonuclease HII, putative [Trypanosoma brucei brucei TREU927]EAN77892.1 ribonuclease HII, putative [Trypanosoma brucei brucei TREU927]SCU67386.1 ribonuclease HII, putative [Trypanosoma equiperdum]
MLGVRACFSHSPALLFGAFRPTMPCKNSADRGSHERKTPWDALRELRVPPRTTVDSVATLDSTLDMVGYQLFRDGLLSPPPLSFLQRRQQQLQFPKHLTPEMRRLEKEKEQLMARMRKNGVVIRRSIKETFLTIGCDEAGRGPLAGPVVGAAVCRIPRSSFNNDLKALYDADEEFQIFDSKSVSETQRKVVYNNITGYHNLFSLVEDQDFVVHHAGGDSVPDNVLKKRLPSHTKLGKLPFKKLLSMQTPYLISYHGSNVSGNYLYFWAIGIANHTYIDTVNIYSASMNTMHRCCLGVWDALNDARFSYHVAPRPKNCSIAQYLFSRFCITAANDDRRRYEVPDQIDLVEGATDFFDAEPVQPPLVLVDGHTAPYETVSVFTDVQTGGCVQPIIEGDKRSLTIAAASCLAKVSRDEIMDYLDPLYPKYHFAENKGYPVDHHMRAVKKHGLSSIHRRSYRPCAEALARQARRKMKDSHS